MPLIPLLLAALAAAQTNLPSDADYGSKADAQAAKSLAKAVKGSSVKDLLLKATEVAREWSPGAALYAVLGRGPRNEERMEAESWTFYFGDPQTQDGAFEIEFQNDEVHGRQGIKAGVVMREYFKLGKFDGRETARAEFEGHDYENCRPLPPKFLDSPDLGKLLRKRKMVPGEFGQYRMALLRPNNNQCDGMGRLANFLTEKPIPAKLLKRGLWIVTGAEETVYLNSLTGAELAARDRKPEEIEDEEPKLQIVPR